MTELLSDLATPSDAELISSVRGGDVHAYGDLFARHRDAANRLARQLVRGPDADDLVSEAFAKVLTVLQGGGGPDVAFRAYLLTAVRRLHVDKMRAGAKLQTSDDMTTYDPGVPFFDTAVASFESGAAAKAFATLPERWQLVLWHLEVEGNKPGEIAPLLGMSANSVSALAYRAREGLRQAFLTMHLNDISDTDCRWVNDHLGAYVRKGLSNRDSTKVQSHLDQCRRCTAMYLELTEVNSNLAAIIAPLLLGAAATGYLASTGAASAGGLGVLTVIGRVRDVVTANAGVATAGAVAASVAAVAAAAVMLTPSSEQAVTADPPTNSTRSAAPAVPGTSPEVERRAPRTEDQAVDVVATPVETPGTTLPLALPVVLPVPEPEPAVDGSADPATDPTEDPAPGATADPEPTRDPDPTPDPTSDPAPEPTPGPTGDPAPVVAPPAPATDPTPTPPPGPTVVAADVSVAGTVVDDAGVHLLLVGSPALPPTVTVTLVSTPDTVKFDDLGDCTVAPSGTSATCLTGATLTGAPGMPALADPSTSYAATLPFLHLADQPADTKLDVSVSLPDGYEDPDTANNTIASYTSRAADLDLSSPTTVDAIHFGRHEFTGTVTNLPTGYAGTLRYDLSSTVDVAFEAATGSGCNVPVEAPTSMVCPAAAGPDVNFVVLSPTGTTDLTGVSITVAPLTGYRDPVRSNNVVSPSLVAYVPPASPLSYSTGPSVVQTGNQTYRLSATVTGIPANATQVVFRLSRGAGGGTPGSFQTVAVPTGCVISGADLTCTVAPGTTTLILGADVRLPGNPNFVLSTTAGAGVHEAPISYLP